MSSPEEQPSYEEPFSPVGTMHSGLAAMFVTPSPKKKDGNSNQFVNDESFINKRKPSSTMVVKGVLTYGEHTLIPVMAKMIHFAVWDSERFVLKDGRPLHMVKLVGAVRNFCVNIKHAHGRWYRTCASNTLVKKKECMAQCQLIYECNSNCYIHVIGKVEDYYGVHKIIAFDI
jgi:hypothetical protein